MILSKKINNFYFLILFALAFTITSCTSKGLIQSAELIKELQVNKYSYYQNPESILHLDPDSLTNGINKESLYSKEYVRNKRILDSLYINLFTYRKKNINNFIINKKLKDFVIK